MGLDTSFMTLNAKTEIASLRNHRDFSDLFFEQDPEPYWPDYTDFLVEVPMIDVVAARLGIDDARVVRAEAALSEAEFEAVCLADEDDHDPADLLPVYRRLLQRLREAAAGPDPLLCVWSA